MIGWGFAGGAGASRLVVTEAGLTGAALLLLVLTVLLAVDLKSRADEDVLVMGLACAAVVDGAVRERREVVAVVGGAAEVTGREAGAVDRVVRTGAAAGTALLLEAAVAAVVLLLGAVALLEAVVPGALLAEAAIVGFVAVLLLVVVVVVVVFVAAADGRTLDAEMGLGLYRLVSGTRPPVPRIIALAPRVSLTLACERQLQTDTEQQWFRAEQR